MKLDDMVKIAIIKNRVFKVFSDLSEVMDGVQILWFDPDLH